MGRRRRDLGLDRLDGGRGRRSCALLRRRHFLRRRLLLRLGCRLGLGLLDDGLATQALRVGEPADAIGRRVVDARRMALHADLELVGEIEHDGVLDAQLSRQLVDPDLLGRHLLSFAAFFRHFQQFRT
jgi:hypothetical protein